MNIFKILGNGHGSINEPNVNAFLGYLLAPYEDHGLGSSFLKRFLSSLTLSDNGENEEDAQSQEEHKASHEYKVFYEQEFIDDKASNIVDIVLVEYQLDRSGEDGKKSAFKSFFSSNRKVRNIFLIEVKINDSAITKDQIISQYNATKKELGEKISQYDYNIKTIYLTPSSDKYIKEFEAAKIDVKYHLTWPTVRETISNLLYDESKGEIEPIDNYIRHTLKAFTTFIDNGFKSEVKEKARNSGNRDIHENIDAFLEEYANRFSKQAIDKIKEFTEFIKETIEKCDDLKCNYLSIRHSKTHPCAVFYNKRKIAGLTARGKNVAFRLNYKSFEVKDMDSYLEKIRSYKMNDEFVEPKIIEFKNYDIDIDEIKKLFKFQLKTIGIAI
jgi:hypothetical protein